jgi:hypothetical protein
VKRTVIFIALSLFSTFSFADEVLEDIGKIAHSKKVAAFLNENKLSVKSISYALTLYCAGGPSNYVIHTNNSEKCVWVQVGECKLEGNKSNVSILSSSTDLDCQ